MIPYPDRTSLASHRIRRFVRSCTRTRPSRVRIAVRQFTFTASEQAFYAEKGFSDAPKRCKSCRQTRKAQRNSVVVRRDDSYGGWQQQLRRRRRRWLRRQQRGLRRRQQLRPCSTSDVRRRLRGLWPARRRCPSSPPAAGPSTATTASAPAARSRATLVAEQRHARGAFPEGAFSVAPKRGVSSTGVDKRQTRGSR